MKRIKFIGDGIPEYKNQICFDYGGEYTLCGLSLDGDNLTAGGFKKTSEKVNCHDCIEMIERCKKINRSEYI